jgi:hypothetical protein
MLKNYFSRSLAVLSLLLLALTTRAQAPTWQQAIVFAQAGGNSSTTNATAVNAAGDVLVAGRFYNSITLGSITLTAPSRHSIELFVAKWSPTTKSFLWAVQAGGTGVDGLGKLAVQGNSVYVTGSYNSAGATFGSINMTSFGGTDAFVAKLTDAGSSATWTWVQHGGGTTDDYASPLAVNGTNVYVGGAFATTTATDEVTFGPSHFASLGGQDGFVAKIVDVGTSPNFTWALPVQGNGNEGVDLLAVNGTALYAAGSTYSIPLRVGSTTLYNNGGLDGYVVKLLDAGSSGNYSWGLSFGGSQSDYVSALAVSGNSVYFSGGFSSPTVQAAGKTFTNVGASGTVDMVVAKLTDAGTSASYQWATQLGGTSNEAASVLLARNGSCYMGGYFDSPTLAIGGTTLTNLGRHDIYVTRFSDTGNTPTYDWALSAGGTTTDEVYTMALSAKSDLYVGGVVHGPVTFGGISAAGSIGSGRDDNAFLATIGNAVPLATTSAAAALRLTLHPNPAHGVTLVQLPTATPVVLTLTDVLGRVVKTQQVASLASTGVPLDLSGLVPGAYLLRTSTGAVGRLVVE